MLGRVPGRPGKIQAVAQVPDDPKLAAAEKAAGLYRSRVRVLHDPITDYERYECEWGYVPNVAAGEDVRILHPAEHQLAPHLPDFDFWILDDTLSLRMHYDPAGGFAGATIEPELIDTFRIIRETMWHLAEPFTGWWERHADLHRDARKVA